MKKIYSLSKNRNFGIGISLIFLIIYFFSIKDFNFVLNKFLIISLVLLSISILKPNVLHLINFGVFKIGLLFMKILSSVNIFIIYFFIIGFIALVMRLLKYDPLFLSKHQILKSQSFWNDRKKKYDSIESMKNQF